MGVSCWDLYLLEHGIQQDGHIIKRDNELTGTGKKETLNTFFEEVEGNKYVPRAVMVDLEPTVMGKKKWISKHKNSTIFF